MPRLLQRATKRQLLPQTRSEKFLAFVFYCENPRPCDAGFLYDENQTSADTLMPTKRTQLRGQYLGTRNHIVNKNRHGIHMVR
jgi:hypothetical protein